MIDHIAVVSEQNNASAAQVSASVGEVSSQITGVSASAQALGRLADAFQEKVSRFDLGEQKLGYGPGDREPALSSGSAMSALHPQGV
jgi:hypothetical protein